MEPNEKVVAITGAASGIGRAMALRFAQEGAHVVVSDLDGDGAVEVADEIKERGADTALAVVCDVTDPVQVAGLIERGEAAHEASGGRAAGAPGVGRRRMSRAVWLGRRERVRRRSRGVSWLLVTAPCAAARRFCPVRAGGFTDDATRNPLKGLRTRVKGEPGNRAGGKLCLSRAAPSPGTVSGAAGSCCRW